jgi:hypothetical protein
MEREGESSRAESPDLLRTMSDAQLIQPFTLPWGGVGTIPTIV